MQGIQAVTGMQHAGGWLLSSSKAWALWRISARHKAKHDCRSQILADVRAAMAGDGMFAARIALVAVQECEAIGELHANASRR
eukprot:3018871-Alexandrium_andersonii.AAC.1